MATSPNRGDPARRKSPPLNLPVRRAKTGITLERIAEETKISTRFLRAIEDEEFDKLPGGVFTTSYLRQYAAAIGIDAGELVEAARQSLSGDEPPNRTGKERVDPARALWRNASNLLRMF
jgi:cytoskeletal protein RodZ